MMTLSPRLCSTTVALTAAPATSGVPAVEPSPSPTIRTSPNSIVAPGSPASFSTEITSSLATRYCFPPVRITAYMGSKLHAETLPDGTPRPGSAHYSEGGFAVNKLGGRRRRPTTKKHEQGTCGAFRLVRQGP